MSTSMMRRRGTRILAGAVAATLLVLALAGSAVGKVVNLRVYNGTYPTTGSIDGTGSVGAPAPFGNGLLQLGFNQTTNQLLVGSSASGGRVYKFSASGTPEVFSFVTPNTAIESGALNSFGDVNVDNSGEAGGAGEGEQGRIYAFPESGAVRAFKPTGEPFEPAGGNFPINYSQSCGAEVAPNGNLWVATWGGGGLQEFDPSTGNPITAGPAEGHINTPGICSLAIDSNENFYAVDESGPVLKYSPSGQLLGEFDPSSFPPGEAKDVAVDRTDNHVYIVYPEFVREFEASGALVTQFGEPEGAYPGLQNAQGVTIDEDNHLVYVTNNRAPNPRRVNTFVRTGPITVPDVETNTPSVTATGATLKGHVDPDAANSGTPINSCSFKWGTNASNLNQTATCDQALPINGPTEVTATIAGLTTGTTYFYKATAANEGNGVTSSGAVKSFQPAGPPEIENESVSEVNTDGATISATVIPAGSNASYWIEFGTTTAYGGKLPEPPGETKDNLAPESISQALSGLNPGTTYHYRVAAENANDLTHGSDHTFTTFPSPASGPDGCANAQVRQQTGAARLLDCRAYELASAADTSGYDVTSSLVPGQVPLPMQPGASNQVLYSLQFGIVPGSGDPTNFGQDPYVATRNPAAKQWETKYVGIPASGTPSTVPFGSPLAGSNSGLTTFAFGNGTLCDPCFSDGSTGIPVHLPNGSLVQGLKGSIPKPSAEPSGYIGQSLSDDGTHLVFGSTSKLEGAATEGNLTIYERDLNAGTTRVVSTMPDGSTMTGTVAGLDVSSNGSRVLVGKAVSTDGKGNTYYDLYMHIGNNPNSVPVADTANGVIFNGMTRDGSKVFFTTSDQLNGDTDSSADLYRADVGSSNAPVELVSDSNNDECDPVPGKEGSNWNVLEGGPTDCSVLGLAGGAGVSSNDGTVFFLSPEELDGEGTLNEPNLFAARPGGAPKFVATIEPGGLTVTDALNDSEVHRYQDFQVSSDGDFAVLASTLSLTGLNTFGRSQVYRYDTDADSLVCASCASTGAAPTGNTTLSSGLNLTDDGRVFFTSVEPLALRDTNNRLDVYEWEEGTIELVSTGISNFDAGLLGVSSDGVNAFFFTRETLAPQDKNGETMKIYDARENGGFLQIPPLPLCAAKDECHGPGTTPAPPPQIGTFKGQGGNAKPKKCKKPKVKRHGKCVKKSKKKKKKKGKRSHG